MNEPAVVDTPSELSPAILKLRRLELIATETRGAAHEVSRFVDNARGRRAAIAREKGELETFRTGDRSVRDHTRRRIDRLAVRLAYADHEIRCANERKAQLEATASEAAGAVDNLAEYLRKELAAMGLA
ncbi:MAG TPA: hypothetical protein VE907_19685 [Gammaproteobacteria bacterium]|nr:hypothetical protein [Gammaproteobacteria bacterium]